MMIVESSFLLLGILILDVFFGDPVYSFHPVRLIGNLCTWLEVRLRNRQFVGRMGGILLNVSLITIILGIWLALNEFFYLVHWIFGWLWQLFTGWSLLAGRDLLEHARRVWNAADNRDLKECRIWTGKMVGRDTSNMDFSASGRAVVESISENLNDGIVAPLLYFILLGIPGMLVYKSVNTMDSMIGYRNERYRNFGWASARLDDYLNWIPARLTWMLISLAAWLHPSCSGFRAFSVGWSEHDGVSSPNAGWCEAAVAGALKVRLCGPIWREGRLTSDSWLGRPEFRVGGTVEDMLRTAQLALIATVLFSGISWFVLNESSLPLVLGR